MSETQTSSTDGTQAPAEGGSFERRGANLKRVEGTQPAPDRAQTEPKDPDVQRAEAADQPQDATPKE